MTADQTFYQETPVDLGRYPLVAMASPAGEKLVAESRAAYLETGVCLLPNFIRDDALAIMRKEATAAMGDAYFCRSEHTVYLEQAAGPQPHRRLLATDVGSVPYDRIGRDTLLRHLYEWDPLMEFIQAVVGKARLYRFADPLGACSINVFREGGEHGWHFDESEFTVTLMLQDAEEGGDFEAVAGLRSGDSREGDAIVEILDGARDRVVRLPFTPGSLFIFAGRQSLHRVSPMRGARPRLVPVLCYCETPDKTNSEEVRRFFWGRSGSEAA